MRLILILVIFGSALSIVRADPSVNFKDVAIGPAEAVEVTFCLDDNIECAKSNFTRKDRFGNVYNALQKEGYTLAGNLKGSISEMNATLYGAKIIRDQVKGSNSEIVKAINNLAPKIKDLVMDATDKRIALMEKLLVLKINALTPPTEWSQESYDIFKETMITDLKTVFKEK